MRAPKFWQHDCFTAEILLPFSVFYFLFTKLRIFFVKSHKIEGAKIICVGNITAGGAGKTPTAIALGKLLKKKKKKFAFISKGYQGKAIKPTKVDPKKHNAKDVGDEPILLAKEGPCWVGRSRIETSKAAIKDGAKFLIFDDGFQDASIKKDVSLLVVDGNYGFGNGFVIPAGPLRGRVDKAIEKADATIMIGNDKRKILPLLKSGKTPLVRAEFSPCKSLNKKQDYVVFAGIGNPDKFSETLLNNGIKISLALEFPDHYYYNMIDINRLKRTAKKYNAKLLTTEKDAVRISKKQMQNIETFPVELSFKNLSKIEAILDPIL